jgi:fructose 1,6-bisphosphatase
MGKWLTGKMIYLGMPIHSEVCKVHFARYIKKLDDNNIISFVVWTNTMDFISLYKTVTKREHSNRVKFIKWQLFITTIKNLKKIYKYTNFDKSCFNCLMLMVKQST